MTHRHRPACILGTHAAVLEKISAKLAEDMHALHGQVSEDAFRHISRVLALIDVASEDLVRIAGNEQARQPDLRCQNEEPNVAPVERN